MHLPSDFPKWDEARRLCDPYEKVKVLEVGLKEDIGDAYFIPYIQLHEFEGLLFSDVETIGQILEIYQGNSRLTELRDIRTQFNTPEEINEVITPPPRKDC